MTFRIGDYVAHIHEDTGEIIVCGTVEAINRSGSFDDGLYISLAPGTPEQYLKTARSNATGYWFAPFHCCRLTLNLRGMISVSAEAVVTNRGWEPDGFDPDAHRDFMKNL